MTGPTTETGVLADPEVVAADHGHWAAGAFPDSLDDTKTHLVCECGMPWTPSEGCLFVQGIRAQRLAGANVQVRRQWAVRDTNSGDVIEAEYVGGPVRVPWSRETVLRGERLIKNWTAVERAITTITTEWSPLSTPPAQSAGGES